MATTTTSYDLPRGDTLALAAVFTDFEGAVVPHGAISAVKAEIRRADTKAVVATATLGSGITATGEAAAGEFEAVWAKETTEDWPLTPLSLYFRATGTDGRRFTPLRATVHVLPNPEDPTAA